MFLVRKRGGGDDKQLFAMKVVRKAALLQKPKTAEHTRTERQVLEVIRASPFLVKLHYAFQTEQKLHLILGFSLLSLSSLPFLSLLSLEFLISQRFSLGFSEGLDFPCCS